ncbi:MAG TPA: SRPBCC family protein [Micromonosporaceae bacterium]|jgi:uncharacterized protein YndB with AHSA1/START domain|nr:SRPBCC family protein [Micromonosporaceae bacterium]
MSGTITGETIFTVEPNQQQVTMSRVFAAPAELVWRATTEPEHVTAWWGPRALTTQIDVADVRAGGQWRYIQRDADGNEFAFHGVYHDVIAPERVVQTFEYEGVPGHVLLETTTFEPVDGGTRVTSTSVFQSIADRDGMVASGMEYGAREGYDRLAELLDTMS